MHIGAAEIIQVRSKGAAALCLGYLLVGGSSQPVLSFYYLLVRQSFPPKLCIGKGNVLH